jgi:hypothetical protein
LLKLKQVLFLFLARLFRRKNQAIMMAVVLLSSCKNFAHYLNILKVIRMKLGIFAYHDKVQLLDKGHNSESNIYGVMPLFNLEF